MIYVRNLERGGGGGEGKEIKTFLRAYYIR